MNPPLVIVGPGRSGTSVVMRALEACGLYLGPTEQMMPGAITNPDGYWEHIGIVRINDAVLEHFNAGWDLPPREPRWDDPELNGLRGLAMTVLAELSSHPHWGWKDPRMCLTLPFWQALVPDLRPVMCVRHPAEVSASLHHFHYTSPAFGRKWWMDCVIATMDACRGKPLLVVDFDAVRESPDVELRRLCSYAGLSPDPEQLATAAALVQPNRHGQYPRVPLAPDLDALYRRLKDAAAATLVTEG
jgi:hypothetical protein